MNIDLRGKHALVCGGSQGIGHAAAVELALLGADVSVLARNAETLATVVRDLPRMHTDQHHAFIAVDVADARTLKDKVDSAANAAPFQILVNNTGGPPGGAVHSADQSAFLDAFQRHLLANQVLVQCVLPGMRAAAFGRIINVISTSVKEPIKNLGVSNTIRGAVASWAKTLATELGPHGITVNNVLPGYTRTQRLEQIVQDRVAASGKTAAEIEQAMLASVPANRFASAAEIAAAIAFLASPAAAYVNGINLPVDGGRTLSL